MTRLRQQADLGHDQLRHVAEAHAAAGLAPDLLDTGEQRGVGVDLFRRFIAAQADIGCGEQHHRHGVVDQRHWYAGDHVARGAGRQQLAGLPALRVEEGELDRRAGAGDAVDRGGAVIGDAAVRRLDDRVDQAARVAVVDADRGFAGLRRNQTGLDGERADAGQHVAAVGAGIDLRRIDRDLREQVIDVGLRMRRLGDDRDLAGDGVRAADAVHLQRMGRAHRRQQHAVARGDVGGQVGFQEIGAARRAPAHQHAGNPSWFAGRMLSQSVTGFFFVGRAHLNAE